MKMDRLSGLVAAGFLAGVIAGGVGQAAAQSAGTSSKLPQASARQNEPTGGSAGAHSTTTRKENAQRQKAMKSGTNDNGPPKTVP